MVIIAFYCFAVLFLIIDYNTFIIIKQSNFKSDEIVFFLEDIDIVRQQ